MIILPYNRQSRQHGAVLLMMVTLLLMMATLSVIFAASYSIMQQKITQNTYANQQAFQAAEAGLEFGINYLQQNSTAILANPVGGYIQNYTSASTTNVSLVNGGSCNNGSSCFSIVYRNLFQNNYNLLLVTAYGTSNDGTMTRMAQEEVQWRPFLYNAPTHTLSAGGNLSMTSITQGDSYDWLYTQTQRIINYAEGPANNPGFNGPALVPGDANIINPDAVKNILSGGQVTLSDIVDTSLNQVLVGNPNYGTGAPNFWVYYSSPSLILNDISQHHAGAANKVSFQWSFEDSSGDIESFFPSSNVYNSDLSPTTSYSTTLAGNTAQLLWINQPAGTTATLDGGEVQEELVSPVIPGFIFGTPSNPAILVVNGDLSIDSVGVVVFYGFLYVSGSLSISTARVTNSLFRYCSVELIGGVVVGGTVTITGNELCPILVEHSSSVLSTIQQTLGYFTVIPGTWKDF